MAKFASLSLSLAIAFAVVALASAQNETFDVVGSVYCDTCDTGFETRVSYPIKGAKVEVECKKDGRQSLNVSGETDAEGKFTLTVNGDHEKEQCSTKAVSSPDASCNISAESTNAPVFLTHKNGIEANKRVTGPFAFKPISTLASCKSVLAEYSLYDDDDDDDQM